MGNRTFLYTTDLLPGSAEDDPTVLASVAEAKNCLLPLWVVMLADPLLGAAQDRQQVFLPSVYGGIYAEREGAEKRLFAVLDFIGTHPALADAQRFRQQVTGLRDFLATLPGAAYSADLNEWFWLSSGDLSPEEHLDAFAYEAAQLWRDLQQALDCGNHAGVEQLLNYDVRDAPATLGFQCWDHRFFWGDDDGGASRLDFATFCERDASEEEQAERADLAIGHGLIRFFEDGYYGLRKDDAQNALVLAPRYDSIGFFSGEQEHYALIEQDGLYGTIDAAGQVLIAPVMRRVDDASEGRTLAYTRAFGFLDDHGRWWVEPVYDHASDFVNGMAAIRKHGRAGYLTADGAELFGDWTDCHDFNDAGVACAETANGATLIDRSGATLVGAGYSEFFYNAVLEAWEGNHHDGDMAAFKADGTPWFSGPYASIDCLADGGPAVVECDGHYGLIARDASRPTIAPVYEQIELLYDALYVVAQDDGLVGAMDCAGQMLIAARFHDLNEVAGVPAHSEETPLDHLVETWLDGRAGIWSLQERRELIPALDYEALALLRFDAQQWFLMRRPDQQIVVGDAAGRPLNEHAYTWLGDAGSGTLQSDWQTMWLHGALKETWLRGEPIAAGRGGATVRLYADGREEGELDQLLRRAAGHASAPIVALEPLVQNLPLPARAPRPVSHVMAGMADPQACFRIGEMFRDGEGVPADARAALRWMATAAAGGDTDARYEYARALMDGAGCAADPATALRLFDDLGPDNVHALNCMGVIYECHLGRRCDPARARALYLRAAEGGEHGLGVAQFNLGRCWAEGIGGPADYDTALSWYEQAAYARKFPPRAAFPDAAWHCAEIHLAKAMAASRAGDEQAHRLQLHQARARLKQAASEGMAMATLALAASYLGVYGGEKNVEAARPLLDEAERSELREQARAMRQEHGL